MEPILSLFVHLLVFLLVFALLYWIVVLVCGVLPAPVQNVARTILLAMLALIAVLLLLGEFGVWGSWGWHHRKRDPARL